MSDTQPQTFWKIAPGHSANFWEECYKGGFICLGWNELGDFGQYKTKSEVEAAIRKAYPKYHKNEVEKETNEVWNFMNLRNGDRILANKGINSIMGIGEVIGPREFRSERPEYRNCVPVQWDPIESPINIKGREDLKDIVGRWPFCTVQQLTPDKVQRLIGSQNSPQVSGDGAGVEHVGTSLPDRFAELCAETFLPASFFADCDKLLKSKRQIILQGAPGTGKTFVAEKLAQWWVGAPSRVQVVQFHESYGYEDFIQGIKPIFDPDTRTTAFRPQQGLFLRVCEAARQMPDHKFVLVIDEINRGKPSRIFGELLYVLEYRAKTVVLQSGAEFSMPPNLYIIGTMNTVDKSISLVDYALRRRFAFLNLMPIEDGHSTVLRKWMEKSGIENATEVEHLFVALNQNTTAKDAALMIGHSYFMLEEARQKGCFTSDMLDTIWKYHILPLVSEYEYDLSPAEIEEKYGLQNIRKQTQRS